MMPVTQVQSRPHQDRMSESRQKERETSEASLQTEEMKGGHGVKGSTMPIAEAFQLFAQFEQVSKAAKTGLRDGENPMEKPVMVLSKEHLESHKSLQTFAQNTEVALRYAYVIGPVVRAILALVEIVTSLVASAFMALQACFIMPENDTEEAKLVAQFKQDEMLANAQYTLTYAFHGLANAVRSIFEATIIGHIVLNVSYDREYRVEYDLADRNRGDIYHTRIFNSLVRETTSKEENVVGETRYIIEQRARFTGVLASANPDFNSRELFHQYEAYQIQAQEIRELKLRASKALSENSKDFRSAEALVRSAYAFTEKYEAANKAIDEKIRQLKESDVEGFRKLDESRPKLSEKEAEMVQLTGEHREQVKRRERMASDGAFNRLAADMFGDRLPVHMGRAMRLEERAGSRLQSDLMDHIATDTILQPSHQGRERRTVDMGGLSHQRYHSTAAAAHEQRRFSSSVLTSDYNNDR